MSQCNTTRWAGLGKLHALTQPGKRHRLELLNRQQRLSKVIEKFGPNQQLGALLFATHNLSNYIEQSIQLKHKFLQPYSSSIQMLMQCVNTQTQDSTYHLHGKGYSENILNFATQTTVR